MNKIRPQTVQPPYTMKSPIQAQVSTLKKKKNGKETADDPTRKTIHSGQFMISRLHDKSPGDYLSDEEEEEITWSVKDNDPGDGFNFDDASKDTYTTYSFGPRSTQTLAIDASLSRLFEHMTLAYSGKITSPKWKPFRGMHLRVKDKIRLNNIIWREWHMQYVFGQNPLVCHFATPLHDDVHTKPEAIVLEGYYWKRRLDTITNEYKRFRKFSKYKRPKPMDDYSTNALLEKVGEVHTTADFPRHQQTSHTDLILNSRDLQDMMDLSDSLFSSLNQPFAFPNPRELSGLGYGDFIQPGLVQLQPNLDDFMDLDPLTDMLTASRSQVHHMDSGQNGSQMKLQHGDIEMTSLPQMMRQSPSSPGSSSRMVVDSPGLASSPGLNEHDPMIVDTENFILNQLQLIQQQKQAEDRSRQQQLHQQKLLELQQKKQQEEQLRHQQQQQQQQKLEQQLLEHLKQEQERQQQQHEQQQQERQQQQQRNQQLQTLLQNPQLKSILTAMGENAPSLLEELTKSLQSQQQQQQQTTTVTQSQTPVLVQDVLKAQLQNSNATQTSNLTQSPSNSGSSSSLISNLLNTNNQTVQQQKPTVQFVNNLSAKSRTSGKFTGSSSILEALNADEKQSALSRMQPVIKLQNKQPSSASFQKRDIAGFTIPNMPLRVKGKPRVIAPAPPAQVTKAQSALSQQNSYLAQLLTTGTYPGALVNVKEEAGLASLPVIQPAPATQSSLMSQSQSSPVSVSIQGLTTDFPTNLLLAAANHAFSSNSLTVKEVLQNVSLAQPSTPLILTSSSPQRQDHVVSPIPSPSQTASPMFSQVNITSPASPASTSMDEYQYTLKSPEPSYPDIQITERREEHDSKKVTHLSSEKKRRYNIKAAGQMQKSGFEVLHSLIPSLSSNPNAKVSKAAMLQKTAEYCRKLKAERSQMQKEADILKQEIGSLNQSISICQQQLPATGVPVTRQRADQMKEMFEEYVKQRTLTNWKFWIFSLIIRNLFDSYNTMVSTASVDELCRSALAWLDQHCSLPALRPIAANAMRHLSTTTSILSDPARVPEQAAQAVIKRQKSIGDENNT